MWQRFLDRFVPLMDDLPSRLDVLDGVGTMRGTGSAPPSAVVPDAASAGVGAAPQAG
jgi:hypothetical protein